MTQIQDKVGAMRERIKIVTRSATRDIIGGESITWTEGPEISAEVISKPIGTDEVQSSNQKSPDAKVDFRIRFREVAYTSEVLYRGNRYQIEGVVPDAHRHFVILETKWRGE